MRPFRLYFESHAKHHFHHLGVVKTYRPHGCHRMTSKDSILASVRTGPREVPVVWDVVDSINCTNMCALLYVSCHYYMVGYACLLSIQDMSLSLWFFKWMWLCIQSLSQAKWVWSSIIQYEHHQTSQVGSLRRPGWHVHGHVGLRVGTWCLMLLICAGSNGGGTIFPCLSFPTQATGKTDQCIFLKAKVGWLHLLHRLKIAMKNSSCDYVTMLRIHGSNVLPN